jgi:hypothetical protein
VSIFTKAGLKLMGVFFGVGFIFGLVAGIVGFTMAIDVMAQVAGAK